MAFDPYHKWLGIGPAEQPADHYRLLGLAQFEADPDVIVSAADQRMGHLRSFGTGPHASESQKLLNEVAAARLVLLNARKKLRYDEELHETIRMRQVASQPVLTPVAESPVAKSPVVEIPVAKILEKQQEDKREQKRLKELHRKYLVLGGGAAAGVVVLGILIYALSGSSAAYRSPPVTLGQQATKTSTPTPPPPAVITPLAPPPAVVAPSGTSEETPSSEQPNPSSGIASPGMGTAGPGVAAPPSAVGSSVSATPETKRGQYTKKSSSSSEAPESDSSAPAEVTAPLSLPDLIEKVKPTVVVIKTDRGLGSGCVVDSHGIIATNHHVMEGATQAIVAFSSGALLQVEGYVAVDVGKDLALLRVSTNKELPALTIAESFPRQGEDVVAIGAPHGLSFTASRGIVSAVRTVQEILRIETSAEAVAAWQTHDRNATWIQTTTPISPGNSGGPLLLLDGRVVGLNTIVREGQNLNFAISATYVTELLAKAAPSPRPLVSLPVRSTTLPGRQGSPRIVMLRMPSVKLPDGKELTEGTVGIPPGWPAQFGIDNQIFFTTYNNGAMQSLIHYGSQGKLIGPAATLYETGSLCTLAYYKDNLLTGSLRLWDQNRSRLLYAEYKRGKKQGLCCLFRKGWPWLIQECDKGEVSAQYLVRYASEQVNAVAEADLSDEEKPSLHAAVEKLAGLEEQIEAGEKRVKKAVSDTFRERDKDLRQARRTEIAQGNRDGVRRQVDSQSAASAQAQVFWRKALSRCGF